MVVPVCEQVTTLEGVLVKWVQLKYSLEDQIEFSGEYSSSRLVLREFQ